ncbi:MAG: release factor glutamine methyltransferase [Cyclobacteriaceae bacterium]|nr:MAG: release factor glutamine methyltransferase [Cyclobacteriaceae bacterium]
MTLPMAGMQCTTQFLREKLSAKICTLYDRREANQIAALIVEHFFKISTTSQLLGMEIVVSRELEIELDEICQRLLDHEPVQYVLGYTEFYGRQFKTDSRALIPRPETGELVHSILAENKIAPHTTVLDIGTGSGCIAITLALETGCSTFALDFDPLALALTAENADRLGVEIDLIKADLFKDLPELPAVDLIVSNPPYVPESDLKLIDNNVKNYEPHQALFVPDSDSLMFYQRIAVIAPGLLKPGGQVFLEIYHLSGQEVQTLFQPPQWSQVLIKKDLNGKDRMVKATLGDN